MAVKLQVIETSLADIAQGTSGVEKVEVNRKAGNPKEFREEAEKVACERLNLTVFELYGEAIIELGDDRLVAKKIGG